MHCGLTTLLLRQSWDVSLQNHIRKSLSSASELKHSALWAIKQLNFDLSKAGELRRLQISVLEEIRNEAYEKGRITKSRTKLFHDQIITQKNFAPGDKVLLYNSRLHIFAGKLKTR